MYLYHGTFADSFAKIVDNGGYIKTNNNSVCNKDSETTLLDNLISKCIKKNLRENCIYLTDDNDCTLGYDYAFTIDVDSLDFNKLYVAENRLLDEILELYYNNSEQFDVDEKIKEYYKSYMLYEEYLAKALCYKSLEYLYYDCIEVEVTDKDTPESKQIKKDFNLV